MTAGPSSSHRQASHCDALIVRVDSGTGLPRQVGVMRLPTNRVDDFVLTFNRRYERIDLQLALLIPESGESADDQRAATERADNEPVVENEPLVESGLQCPPANKKSHPRDSESNGDGLNTL